MHPRHGAGGLRAARSMPRRPSAGRRARRRVAGPVRGARAAPARRGTCGSARRRRRGESARSLAVTRGRSRRARPRARRSSARTGRAPARRRMRPSHRSTRRTAPRARTPSPRLEGRDSPAPPPGGAPPRAGGVLPIPGSPSTAMHADVVASRDASASSNCSSSDSRPTVGPTLNSSDTVRPYCRVFACSVKGSSPMISRLGDSMLTTCRCSSSITATPRRVRCRLRRLDRLPKPAAAWARGVDVSHRRPRALVARPGRRLGRGAVAPAAVSRPADHADRGQGRRDPMRALRHDHLERASRDPPRPANRGARLSRSGFWPHSRVLEQELA